jgi:hypothetical protein
MRSNEPVCSETSPKFSGTLAHHVEDAARRGRAVEHGRWAGDDLGTIEEPGIDARNAKWGALQAQSVEVLLDIEAARLQRLEAEIAVIAEIDAGRVAHEVADALGAPHIHFLAGDDGN